MLLTNQLAFLIELFVELRSIPQIEVERVMDCLTLQSFLALDLLRVSGALGYRMSHLFLIGVADETHLGHATLPGCQGERS